MLSAAAGASAEQQPEPLQRPQPLFLQQLPASAAGHLQPFPGTVGQVPAPAANFSNSAGTGLTAPPLPVPADFLPVTVLLPSQPAHSMPLAASTASFAPSTRAQELKNNNNMNSSSSKPWAQVLGAGCGGPPPAKKKFISPFSPEATVPLPSQLDELGNMGTTVWQRNKRERERVRCVNDGYANLREHLPLMDSEKKLSKVDTLRLAIIYIHHLEALTRDLGHERECACFLHFQPSGNLSN